MFAGFHFLKVLEHEYHCLLLVQLRFQLAHGVYGQLEVLLGITLMLLPISSRDPGIAANAGIFTRNLLEKALFPVIGNIMTKYSLPTAAVRAGYLQVWAFQEMESGDIHELPNLFAVATHILTSRTNEVVLFQLLD